MRLQTTKDGSFHFYLEHPVLGPSSRFTRTYGSAWLVRVRISKEIFSKSELSEKLRTFLLRPFILNGRVYRLFYANKDHNAYLMATNETYSGTSLLRDGQSRLVSLLDFFSTHNNLSSNNHQARPALSRGRGSHFIFRQLQNGQHGPHLAYRVLFLGWRWMLPKLEKRLTSVRNNYILWSR